VTERRHSEPLPLGGDQGPPYSKGWMARALMATGVGAVAAYELARRIELDLDSSGVQATTLERIEELACELLGREAGGSAIQRLRRYSDFQELDLPIVLLIGGATGTGKSTVATEAAYRLGITRVTTTDFIRQTVRAFFSRCSTDFSTRRGTCSSASGRRSTVRWKRAGRWCSKASTSFPACCRRRSRARS